MAEMNLVTGYAGKEHVTSADAGMLNAAMIGSGQFVVEIGGMLAASVITSNKIQIRDGVLMMQGRMARINPGESVELPIENGETGYRRNDLIVARYEKDASTGIETMSIVVIKGAPTTGIAADPLYAIGDIINDGAVINEMPLFRIPLDGLTVQNPVQLYEVFQGTSSHSMDRTNPHGVTASQVGAAEAAHLHRLDDLSNVHICESSPSEVTNGDWYFVKSSS